MCWFLAPYLAIPFGAAPLSLLPVPHSAILADMTTDHQCSRQGPNLGPGQQNSALAALSFGKCDVNFLPAYKLSTWHVLRKNLGSEFPLSAAATVPPMWLVFFQSESNVRFSLKFSCVPCCDQLCFCLSSSDPRLSPYRTQPAEASFPAASLEIPECPLAPTLIPS